MGTIANTQPKENTAYKEEILAQIKESIYCIEDEMTLKAIKITIDQWTDSIKSISRIP